MVFPIQNCEPALAQTFGTSTRTDSGGTNQRWPLLLSLSEPHALFEDNTISAKRGPRARVIYDKGRVLFSIE